MKGRQQYFRKKDVRILGLLYSSFYPFPSSNKKIERIPLASSTITSTVYCMCPSIYVCICIVNLLLLYVIVLLRECCQAPSAKTSAECLIRSLILVINSLAFCRAIDNSNLHTFRFNSNCPCRNNDRIGRPLPLFRAAVRKYASLSFSLAMFACFNHLFHAFSCCLMNE